MVNDLCGTGFLHPNWEPESALRSSMRLRRCYEMLLHCCGKISEGGALPTSLKQRLEMGTWPEFSGIPLVILSCADVARMLFSETMLYGLGKAQKQTWQSGWRKEELLSVFLVLVAPPEFGES